MDSIGNLTNDIMRELQRFAHVLTEDVDKAAEEVAKDLVKDLKSNSPKSKGKGGGKYAKGWKLKKRGNKLIVYNKDRYQLTHLLEKGHVKRGGGRVPAKIHIAPAEQKAVDSFLNKVEQAVRR